MLEFKFSSQLNINIQIYVISIDFLNNICTSTDLSITDSFHTVLEFNQATSTSHIDKTSFGVTVEKIIAIF